MNKTFAQSTGAVEYTDCTSADGKTPLPNESPGCDTKQSDDEGQINAGDLGNAEYPFIAIAPRFTLARSGSTLQGSYIWVK